MNDIDFSSIDFSLLTFKPPEKVKGSFIGFVNYNGKDMIIKTPLLKNINGITKTESKSYLDLEFNKENLQFYEFLCEFDDFIIKKIQENSLEWFNKEFPLDVIEDFYVSVVKHKQVPKLRITIPQQKGAIDCKITDLDDVEMELKENEDITLVIQFLGLKFLKQKVISEWVPLKIVNNVKLNNSLSKEVDNEKYNIDLENLDDYLDLENTLEDPISNDIETQDLNDINLEDNIEDNIEDNEDNVTLEVPETENYLEQDSNYNILEDTKKELDKYKLLFQQNENKFIELKKNIIKCLEL